MEAHGLLVLELHATAQDGPRNGQASNHSPTKQPSMAREALTLLATSALDLSRALRRGSRLVSLRVNGGGFVAIRPRGYLAARTAVLA